MTAASMNRRRVSAQIVVAPRMTAAAGSEASAVTAFSESLREAAAAYNENPLGQAIIPNWNRVLHAIPGFLDLILDVAEDMELSAAYG